MEEEEEEEEEEKEEKEEEEEEEEEEEAEEEKVVVWRGLGSEKLSRRRIFQNFAAPAICIHFPFAPSPSFHISFLRF
jgi:hypothetical protein